MGSMQTPRPVMLFCSILSKDSPDAAREILRAAFGETAFESPVLPFDYTTYYEQEMGSPLIRKIFAFDDLIPRDSLPDVKIRTNGMEAAFLRDGKRMVNLDPGILTLENACLATTKPYSHRIYLAKGIWTEITLMYQDDSYHALPWTYPDYASRELIAIFNAMRGIYRGRIKCQAV